MIGRRRDDVAFGQFPNDVQPGDLWRYLAKSGEPLKAGCGLWKGDVSGNLTNEVWGYCPPEPCLGYGTLVLHTVRIEDDGTVSIRPGDGSSNSVLHDDGRGHVWHGYVDHGEWRSV